MASPPTGRGKSLATFSVSHPMAPEWLAYCAKGVIGAYAVYHYQNATIANDVNAQTRTTKIEKIII